MKIVFVGSDRGRETNCRGPERFDDVVLFIRVHLRGIAEFTIVTLSMSHFTV